MSRLVNITNSVIIMGKYGKGMVVVIDKVEIGQRIARLATERGWSLRDLERRSGLTHTALWQITRGAVLPRVESLIMFSVIFSVTTDYILGLSDDSE